MLFLTRSIARKNLFSNSLSNALSNACKSKYQYPLITQFHTATTCNAEEDYAKKGSVQYKLRGKVTSNQYHTKFEFLINSIHVLG